MQCSQTWPAASSKTPPILPQRRILKILLSILLIAIIHIPISVSAQSITYSGKNVSLQKLFKEIKKQTKYVVVFNPKLLDSTVTTTVNVKNQPLEEFLRTILSKTDFTYSMVGNTIVVSKKNSTSLNGDQRSTPMIVLLPRDISGNVYDSRTNQPLAFVSILVAGAARGTQTNERGAFTLKNVEAEDKITFTFIGYESVTLRSADLESNISVRMKLATSELDRAVVKAYGVTSKRLSTGSIAKVTAEEIERQPVMNPLLALQGRVPGLVMTPTAGNSSSPVKIEIRGRNAIDPNQITDPLYVVDGIPINQVNLQGAIQDGVSYGIEQAGPAMLKGQSPLFGLNPRDIESIEVLKDADATAIYGSRAANGVVLINTKKGRPGKTKVDITYQDGLVIPSRHVKMLSTKDYLAIRREAFKNDGIYSLSPEAAPDLLLWDSTRQTDWQKEILGTGRSNMASVGLSGGDARNTFRLNASYNKQVDLMASSGGTQRGSFAFNFRHRSPDEKLTMEAIMNYATTKVDAVNYGFDIYNLPPNAPPIYNKDGKLNFEGWRMGTGVLQKFVFGYLLQPMLSKSNQFNGNINIGYELLPGLSVNMSAGVGTALNNNQRLVPIVSLDPLSFPLGDAMFGNTKSTNIVLDPRISYTTMIGRGRLTAQLMGNYQYSTVRGLTNWGMGYTNDNMLHSINNAPFKITIENYGENKFVSLRTTLNYNWDNKYLVNLSGARDGSSRFAPGKQFGHFGSAGLGWIASEETFMRKLLPEWFSFLKFNGSYGVTGSDMGQDYRYLSRWSVTDPAAYQMPVWSYGGIQSYVPTQAVNDKYHWQSNRQLNLATTLGFLKDRLTLSVDYYVKETNNQLTEIPTAIITGFPSVIGNWGAQVRNSGLEATLAVKVIEKKDLNVNLGFNISANRNKLVSYPGIENSPYATRYKVGKSLTTEYLLHLLGVDPLTGEYAFKDYNNDGVARINLNTIPGTGDDDRYIERDRNPILLGAFMPTVYYKNFSLFLTFQFKKQYGYNALNGVVVGRMMNMFLPDDLIKNHWQKPGDNSYYQRYTTAGGSNINTSDGSFTDASFMRLTNASVSYSFSEKLLKKAGMKGCVISVNAQNLFVLSRYKGLDPEMQSLSNVPNPRLITSNITINF
ncbi:MAG: SusC/RagA family TonB-linked outer membrane protein [Pseudobacter sp.]|uniref:SusC/RagA family TonB-linked outer membrane protein n=1 Tax=Pseudobacter sp. TaxID=2045420 RepID=UPI003F7DDC34